MNSLVYPLLACILGSGDIVYEKAVFNKKGKKYKIFVPIMFAFAFIFQIIFFYPFLAGKLPENFWGFQIFGMLLIMVVIACVRNMMYYYSFQKEGLCEIEPFMAFVPLLTILVAGMVYPSERNVTVFILALIASLALIFSHIKKKHLVFHRDMLPILAVIILEAVENNIAKELLYNLSPVALYTIRSGLVALALFIFTRPKLKEVNTKEWKSLMLISFIWVLTMIFTYYGYQKVGVVYSSLILMLNPIIILFGSYIFLKDKSITKRNVVVLIIVIICVALAQILT